MHQDRRLTRGPRPVLLFSRALLVLVIGLLATGAALAGETFLQPEQAFRVAGRADGADAVRVRWVIADGYYLYKAKLRFESQTPGVKAGSPEFPPAQTKRDATFGDVEVYHRSVEVRVPLIREAGSANTLTLQTIAQGCADAGLCYPPQRQPLVLQLPQAAAADRSAAVAATTGPDSVKDPIQSPSAAAAEPRTRGRSGGPTLGVAEVIASSKGFGVNDEIRTVEQAFEFQAAVVAPDLLELTWDIAPGTYLYRDKMEITLEGAGDVGLGTFKLPPGKIEHNAVLPDGSTGDMEVYHDQVRLSLPLLRGAKGPSQITLVAKYQGCAERGICYPPQTQRVKLGLPEASTLAATSAPSSPNTTPATARTQPDVATAPAMPVAEQDRVASVLAGGNLLAVIALFFGFGLLLAFTPCVFPMIPILSGIIAGEGPDITTRKAFTLSLVYVLAMALTYTLAGVLAGLFGANLQAAFQNPWILGAFALIFVLLALSMFGFYHLQIPTSLQSKLAHLSNKQEGGTLIGVAIMGLLSALIVGPCVAPPLFGALIYISQTGDAVLGGIALFAMSLGMGAPLIAIGTFEGSLLPRAGVWMHAVKAVFGVALLGVAIVLLERIVPAAVAMLLWGLLLICSAVYLGVLTRPTASASGWAKLWQGLGVFLLIYGFLMLVGAAAGGKDTLQPLRGLLAGGGTGIGFEHRTFKRIKTAADLDRELTAAQAAGRPVMLDFYADWCVSCKELERDTFSDATVAREMGRFVLLQADVTANDAADQALMQGRFQIPGPPAILFFDPAGTELKPLRVVGFTPAAEFAQHLRRIAP